VTRITEEGILWGDKEVVLIDESDLYYDLALIDGSNVCLDKQGCADLAQYIANMKGA
jgi:hypothetical protein